MAEGAEPTVAPAVPADLAEVTALLRACALPTEDLPPSLDQFFAAREGGRLIGVVGVEAFGGLGLLRSLAVSPEWRGKRLAHRLWDEALAGARRLGLRELFLLTTTAEPLFARWGFARIAREEAPGEIRDTEEFRTLCPGSAAIMRLSVPHEFLRPSG